MHYILFVIPARNNLGDSHREVRTGDLEIAGRPGRRVPDYREWIIIARYPVIPEMRYQYNPVILNRWL